MMNSKIGEEFQCMLGLVSKEFANRLTTKEMAYLGINTFVNMAYFFEREGVANAIVHEAHFDAIEELRSAGEMGRGLE